VIVDSGSGPNITADTCICSAKLKQLQQWNILLGTALVIGLLGAAVGFIWVHRSFERLAASEIKHLNAPEIPDVISAKRFVLVDDSGQELATLGRVASRQGTGKPDIVRLSMHSIDNYGQVSLNLLPRIGTTDGSVWFQLQQSWKFEGSSPAATNYASMAAGPGGGQMRLATDEMYNPSGPIHRALTAKADHQSARVEICMTNCTKNTLPEDGELDRRP
jgi:hypothetical protein